MKYFKLTDEEQKLLDEVERGEWVPVKDQEKEKKEAMDEVFSIEIPLKKISGD